MKKAPLTIGTLLVGFASGWRLAMLLKYTSPSIWFSTPMWTVGTLSIFAGIAGSAIILGVLLFLSDKKDEAEKSEASTHKSGRNEWEPNTPKSGEVTTKTCKSCGETFDFSEKFIEGNCLLCSGLTEESSLSDIDSQLALLQKKKAELAAKED